MVGSQDGLPSRVTGKCFATWQRITFWNNRLIYSSVSKLNPTYFSSPFLEWNCKAFLSKVWSKRFSVHPGVRISIFHNPRIRYLKMAQMWICSKNAPLHTQTVCLEKTRKRTNAILCSNGAGYIRAYLKHVFVKYCPAVWMGVHSMYKKIGRLQFWNGGV